MAKKIKKSKSKSVKSAVAKARRKKLTAKKHPSKTSKTKPKLKTTRSGSTPVAKSKRDQAEKQVERLLQKGRGRGFITYAELLKEFPLIEKDLQLLEEIYDKFELAGIDVLEEGGLLDEVSAEKVLPKGGLMSEGGSLDSVQLYLKKIYKHKLINSS